MTDREIIALQSWWLGELSGLTQKLLKEEEKRQDKVRSVIDKKLGEYQTLADIQEAYGCGSITEKKYEKLMDLWEQRERSDYSDNLYEAKRDILTDLYRDAKRIMDEAIERLNHAGEE